MKKNKLLLSVMSMLFVVLLGGGLYYIYSQNVKNASKEKPVSDQAESQEKELAEDTKNHEKDNEEEKINKKVDKMLNNMTIEEKVGQMFIVTPEQLDSSTECTYFTDIMKDAMKKYPVSGVIYFSENLVDRDQIVKFNEDFQSNSKIPMFIGVDEEGGRVARIADNENMGTTKFDSMRTIGDSKDVNKAYEVGNTIGREIHELGFNLDFAPDADVITNSENTEIGDRAFGTDAEIVSKMVSQVVRGLHDNEVCSALKHFPGHGGSKADSHNEFSSTEQTLDGMREVEFLPFKAGIMEDTDFVLISHIAAPNVTGDNTPCSLNSKIINELLREELGYNNIVITDALNMKAVSDYYTPEQSALLAVQSGADILLMTPSLDRAYYSIINAVNDGTITEARIDESVRRILKVKLKRNIINN